MDNRWNSFGEPTLYLASDLPLAVAEFARHLDQDYHPTATQLPVRRHLFRFTVDIDAVLDFGTSDAWQAIGGLANAPSCFLDRATARAVARFVRVTTSATAMRVPSVAFLDDPSRWSLVVFLEKLSSDPSSFVRAVADARFVSLGR
jgi:RES domain-containing protein